jgi:serine/threonine protein kinase/tetratricopeptide (TPR) repeat protein
MIGQTVSHYKIIEKLGEGGMGIVYRAHDTTLDRDVALKFLPREVSSSGEERSRFLHEAKAASALDHSNICTIHEVAQAPDGQLFIAMSYYPGESLREKLNRGPLEVHEAVCITMQVADGLQAAHELGIVHRDIKASNILVTDRGQVKILDFGLAYRSEYSRITVAGLAIGTAAYMSPEQALGQEVDCRSDIFSLGVVLYQLLAGKLPFRGEHPAALMYSIVNEQPLPLISLNPKVSSALEQIVLKSLAKNREERYQHVVEMSDDLRRIESGKTVSARPRLPVFRWKMLWYAVLAFALVLAGETVYRVFTSPVQSTSAPVVLAVLLFEDQTQDESVRRQIPNLQRSLSFGLSQKKDVGIFDPSNLNGLLQHELGSSSPHRGPELNRLMKEAKITHMIDGVVLRSGNKYEIHSNVVDPSSGEIRYAVYASAGSSAGLQASLDSMAYHLQSYFEMILHLEAAKELEPWLEHRSANIEALIAFEKAYELWYHPSGAWIPYLEKAIELDSSFVAPHLWLILGAISANDTQKANQHYRTLRRLESGGSPFEQAMINWIGAVLDKNLSAQERDLEMALQHAPGNVILLNGLAATQMEMEKFDQARETLLPVVESKWNYSPAYMTLAMCYTALKEYDNAQEVLEQSLTVKPVSRAIYPLLITLVLRKEDTVKANTLAEQYVQRSHELNVPTQHAYTQLAAMCAAEGFDDFAICCYRKALSHGTDSPEIRDSLGNALYRNGKTLDASREYIRALELDSTSVNSHRMLSRINESEGRRTEALRHYREYLKFDSLRKAETLIRNIASKNTN